MKKILFIFSLVVVPLLALANDDAFRIDSWKYEAQVHYDNTWTVKETINVTFLEERHGIFRYIPTVFREYHPVAGGNAEYDYHIKIDSITVNGYNFETSEKDDEQENLIIRIGEENVMVSGNQSYVISYTMRYPSDRYEMSDALYHTVLGPDAQTTIGSFSFRIAFDKELPHDIASRLHVFSGKWGSKDNAIGIEVKADQRVISGTATDIAPGNGITLRAELPEGFYENPYEVGTMVMWVFAALSIVLLIIALLYLIFHRRERPISVIGYSAPDGISSAEVGVITDSSADLSDLTSLIVWFASKGFIKITERNVVEHKFKKDDADLELTKLRDLPDDAPKYQKEFWKVFFDGRDTILLSELGDQSEHINKSLLSLGKYFSGKRSLTKIHWMSLLMVLLYVICGTVFIPNTSSVYDLDTSLMLYSIFLWALPIAFTICIRIILSNYDMIKGVKWRLTQFAIIIAIGLVDMGIFWAFFFNEHNNNASLEMLLTVIGGGWLLALFSGRIPRDTDYRKEKMSQLLGFREFIEKSELPLLKSQVDENPSLFYDVLPYAMVFGLTKKWQDKFKDIDIQRPDWYVCNGSMNNINGMLVANHLIHNINHSASDAIKVSSHSLSEGSGSGGSGSTISFAGGGGGGGGVGSW